jgi:AcrR family transcriptional regulator
MSQPDKRGPGRAKVLSHEERRGRILEAAGQLFVDEGYASTNMERIAQSSGMSKKTLYQMFESKEALFAALVCDVEVSEPGDSAQADTGQTPEQLLTEALIRIAAWVLAPRQIELTRLVISESRNAPDLASRFRKQGIETGRQILLAHLRAIRDSNRLKIENLDQVASILFGAAIGDLQLRALTGEDIDAERQESLMREKLSTVVNIVLSGMKTFDL